MEQAIASKIWQMHGPFIAATPGLLMLDEGKVSFVTEEGELFKVPVAEVKEVKWPFISFGMAVNAVIKDQKYKFSFMKPNGASELNDSTLKQLATLTEFGRGIDAIASLAKWGETKKSAKEWKAVLGS